MIERQGGWLGGWRCRKWAKKTGKINNSNNSLQIYLEQKKKFNSFLQQKINLRNKAEPSRSNIDWDTHNCAHLILSLVYFAGKLDILGISQVRQIPQNTKKLQNIRKKWTTSSGECARPPAPPRMSETTYLGVSVGWTLINCNLIKYICESYWVQHGNTHTHTQSNSNLLTKLIKWPHPPRDIHWADAHNKEWERECVLPFKSRIAQTRYSNRY